MSLNLDTRQRAMLAAMGVRVWQPPSPGPSPEPPPAPTPRSLAPPPISIPAARPSPAPMTLKALPTGLADMDWSALENAAKQCQACGLCETRQQSVFAHGNTLVNPARTDWLIVTDPPSEEEERSGKLFVNTDGELLDAMLMALGLSRQSATAHGHVTLVPVLKCRVPDQRNPHAQELQQCRAYLEHQVALLQPQVIVAMGRWAVQSVLSTTSDELASQPLGKLRGQVHRFANTPLVVTYHPRSLLRTPLDKAKAWADLCLAHSLTRRP
ncbi:MAG: uracil-DNA glycosylase [Betaproteobacteria bacterium]|nr:uracil-DNA glycosylase [Betaproteobacteria bacterium]